MKQFSIKNIQYSIFNIQFLIIFFLLFICSPASSQVHEASEYEVKATFIYNFANFVEWPKGTLNGVINLCILGDDPFEKLLDSVSGMAVGKRKIALKRTASLKDIIPCRVLFISASEKTRLKEIIGVARDNNILTIGDTEGVAKKGVIINLFMDKDRVRFEINPEAARRASLRISPRILDLARIVKEAS